jgi:hypothetical protein
VTREISGMDVGRNMRTNCRNTTDPEKNNNVSADRFKLEDDEGLSQFYVVGE